MAARRGRRARPARDRRPAGRAAWWGQQPASFPLTDEPTATRFAILEDGEVAGLIQYSEELDPDYRHASIDLFVDEARHGRGLGSDAVRTLADHLVTERGHHRVTIDPAADNHAAIRAYEKAGFRPVGVMRAAWRGTWTGAWRDTLFMERVRPVTIAPAAETGGRCPRAP